MKEKLSWIIDRDKNTWKDEEDYKENREFVHSLGLKSDYVGWSELDLGNVNADAILDKMEKYKDENSCLLRGYYERRIPLQDSKWYKLEPRYTQIEYEVNDDEIKAYMIPKNMHCIDHRNNSSLAIVSEELRNLCIEKKFSGIDFKWMKDVGKYKSRQYFNIHLTNNVPFFYSGNNYSVSDPNERMKLSHFGGKLPRLVNMFYRLNIDIPVCINEQDLPETDFSYFNYRTNSYVETGILIRKSVADILLQHRLITSSDLIAIKVLKEIPSEYEKFSNHPLLEIGQEDIQESFKLYRHFLQIPKQERKVTEKMALQLLRKQKKEDKEFFNKSLPKKNCENLMGTIYEIMVPFYKICDGSVLSDEYTLLSYSESVKGTMELQEMVMYEEWLKPIEGVLIAKGADGDWIVLNVDKRVTRYSHEDFDVIDMWDSAESFIYDAI
jgi:hypothetical protein